MRSRLIARFWKIDYYDWDITKNEFLIYDIDNDGRDELIINFTESYGMLAAIYDHNSAWEYPYDVDTSRTGLVYYIYSPWVEIGDVDPVDLTEYEKWHDQYTDGKEPLKLPFMKLTEDNIKKVEQ